MKCLYYIAPDLKDTREVTGELRETGVMEWLMHVISKDEAGLRREQIQSGNYLETTDVLRIGIIGANLGLFGAVAAAGLVMWFEPFGIETPKLAYLFLLAFFTLFGAWVGGLIGLDNDSRKIRRFHDEIDSGKYLILIYVPKEQERQVRAMMEQRHPSTRLVAVDRHFINPFKRARRPRATVAAPGAEAGAGPGRQEAGA
jgi:hypothetical protein